MQSGSKQADDGVVVAFQATNRLDESTRLPAHPLCLLLMALLLSSRCLGRIGHEGKKRGPRTRYGAGRIAATALYKSRVGQ